MSVETQTPKSPEELAQMRDKLKTYYKEQNEVLIHQKEYETLLADIDEAKLRRMSSIIRMAQLRNQPKEDTPTPKQESETK